MAMNLLQHLPDSRSVSSCLGKTLLVVIWDGERGKEQFVIILSTVGWFLSFYAATGTIHLRVAAAASVFCLHSGMLTSLPP